MDSDKLYDRAEHSRCWRDESSRSVRRFLMRILDNNEFRRGKGDNKHDRHILRAAKTMRLICIFNPALTGKEVHDENGGYPAP